MDVAGIRFGFRSHRDAVGAVLDLRRIAGCERACEDAVRSRECEKLSVTRQSEARVQLTFGLAAVLSGGKHEEVFAGAERHRGDAPLVWLVGTVAQGPPFQINGLLAAVVELDPIREVAIFVSQRGLVSGHELADQDSR